MLGRSELTLFDVFKRGMLRFAIGSDILDDPNFQWLKEVLDKFHSNMGGYQVALTMLVESFTSEGWGPLQIRDMIGSLLNEYRPLLERGATFRAVALRAPPSQVLPSVILDLPEFAWLKPIVIKGEIGTPDYEWDPDYGAKISARYEELRRKGLSHAEVVSFILEDVRKSKKRISRSWKIKYNRPSAP